METNKTTQKWKCFVSSTNMWKWLFIFFRHLAFGMYFGVNCSGFFGYSYSIGATNFALFFLAISRSSFFLAIFYGPFKERHGNAPGANRRGLFAVWTEAVANTNINLFLPGTHQHKHVYIIYSHFQFHFLREVQILYFGGRGVKSI